MRASHILIEFMSPGVNSNRRREEAKIIADEVRERIVDGESFSDLAGVYSDCPSRHEGGDLGAFGPGAMHSKFEAAVQALRVGDLSGVVETPFGYHIIRRTG